MKAAKRELSIHVAYACDRVGLRYADPRTSSCTSRHVLLCVIVHLVDAVGVDTQLAFVSLPS